MARNWTFGRKIGAGFAFAGVTVLLVAVAGYQSTHRLIENDALVSDTHQVRSELSNLLSLLKDAETGQRGFDFTCDDTYLEPYEAALTAVGKTFEDLRKLTSDNPNQQRRLEAVRPLIDAKLAELKATIGQRKTAGFEPTAKVV